MGRKICFLALYTFLSAASFAYCPDKDSLWKKLVFLRDSSTLSPAMQLRELLTYDAEIKNCSYQNDSTHAFLLQRIGVAYFMLGDYLKAVEYEKKSTQIINIHAGSTFINATHNIRNYYSLYLSYDALNKISEKMESLDSVVAISMRLKSVDRL